METLIFAHSWHLAESFKTKGTFSMLFNGAFWDCEPHKHGQSRGPQSLKKYYVYCKLRDMFFITFLPFVLLKYSVKHSISTVLYSILYSTKSGA